MNRFENKVVLVTGGSRNTGLEIVSLFLEEGARLVMDSGSSTLLYPTCCEDGTSNMRQK